MKKTFKKITAAVMAATTLAVSMVGMTAFAANTTTNDVISTVETENADNVLRIVHETDKKLYVQHLKNDGKPAEKKIFTVKINYSL